jgi:hypothetical protein
MATREEDIRAALEELKSAPNATLAGVSKNTAYLGRRYATNTMAGFLTLQPIQPLKAIAC